MPLSSCLHRAIRIAAIVALSVCLASCVRFALRTPAKPLSPEQQQAELARVKADLQARQMRIEVLEQQIAALRKQLVQERDRRIVLEIQRKVEELRGLRAKQPLEMSYLTDAILNRLIDREIRDRGEAFGGWELFLKHFGLVPAEMNVEGFLRALYSEQVAGLYDDETKKLYLSEKFDITKTFSKMFLAHEICHALQDQHFNLTSSPIRLKNNDDRALAAAAVAEGDGMMLMTQYMAEERSWRILLELPALAMMDQKMLSSAPSFFSQSLLFPYLYGNEFMMKCMEKWGSRGRNRPFQPFPASTEQILHPEKYIGPDVDRPTEIDLARALSRRLIPRANRYENVGGEFGIRCMLADRLSQREAERAAAGWDGDALVFGGRLDGPYALAWLSVWDGENDAEEFAEALKRFFQRQRKALKTSEESGSTFWMSDKQGEIALVRDGERVACVHADTRERAERVLHATLGVKVQRVP
ncbi:MAG: hypothetical protein N3D11_03035 [Candidatus Sumerlaeia bacterium]|nr:hypothetical protein [Candidatus Sumerlaeia bacterium]